MFYLNKLMDKLNVDSFNSEQLDAINNHQKEIHKSLKELILFGGIFYLINCLEPNSVMLNLFLLIIDICISLYVLRLVLFMCFGDLILIRKLKKMIKKGIDV